MWRLVPLFSCFVPCAAWAVFFRGGGGRGHRVMKTSLRHTVYAGYDHPLACRLNRAVFITSPLPRSPLPSCPVPTGSCELYACAFSTSCWRTWSRAGRTWLICCLVSRRARRRRTLCRRGEGGETACRRRHAWRRSWGCCRARPSWSRSRGWRRNGEAGLLLFLLRGVCARTVVAVWCSTVCVYIGVSVYK